MKLDHNRIVGKYIAFLLEDKGDYKLYSLVEHFSTSHLFKLLRYSVYTGCTNNQSQQYESPESPMSIRRSSTGCLRKNATLEIHHCSNLNAWVLSWSHRCIMHGELIRNWAIFVQLYFNLCIRTHFIFPGENVSLNKNILIPEIFNTYIHPVNIFTHSVTALSTLMKLHPFKLNTIVWNNALIWIWMVAFFFFGRRTR